MTSREAFESYSGLLIPLKENSTFIAMFPAGNARFIGYNKQDMGGILVERKGGNGIQGYLGDHIVIENLPTNIQVWAMSMEVFDWDRVGLISAGPHQCCLCGKEYDNKREHRKVCR